MLRTTLSRGDGVQLDLVEPTPDEGEGPFSFQTICMACGRMVAITTYTPADQYDPTMEARIEQNGAEDLRAARMHQLTCTEL